MDKKVWGSYQAHKNDLPTPPFMYPKTSQHTPPLHTNILPTEQEDYNNEWVQLITYHPDYMLGHDQPPPK